MNQAVDSARPYDAVLLLGFGGPEEPSAIRPFLDRVLAGRTIPPARYELVVSHYERMGGASPYNELTRRQARALEHELQSQDDEIPIALAYRCANPDIEEVLAQLAQRGAKRVRGVILAPHRGSASWGRYQDSVERAQAKIGPSAPVVEYIEPYFDHPLFIRAHAERATDALANLGSSLDEVEFIFTAHSIPLATPDVDVYVSQITRTAELIAEQIGTRRWRVAYQSRSGSPHEPWLEPDIKDALKESAARGAREIVVSPIGFLCDHVEVLYDLDVDARATADSLNLLMMRAQALNDHPAFIRTLAELVR